MKTPAFFITILFLSLSLIQANAQTFQAKKAGGFNAQSGQETSETFEVEGKTFAIFATAKGTKYVQAKSAAGNIYPVWMFKPTGLKHEGKDVYVSSKGTYCIYKLTKAGYPYPVWLEKTE